MSLSGLPLSLQCQNVHYVNSFHDDHRTEIVAKIQACNWKRQTDTDFSNLASKLKAIPSLQPLFQEPETLPEFTEDRPEVPVENGSLVKNGKPPSATTPKNLSERGIFVVSKHEKYAISDCVAFFLRELTEYCNLCSMLPSITIDLGLKMAELFTTVNSTITQMVLGAGAIKVETMKTITIKELALDMRSVQLILRILPFVLVHFQTTYKEKHISMSSKAVNGASPDVTKAELKKLDSLKRQVDKAYVSIKDHIEELHNKIADIGFGIVRKHFLDWVDVGPAKQTPSTQFKVIGRQLSRLLEGMEDTLPR